jgi:hypothetical protein
MKATYRFLAYGIAVLVLVQAFAIAWAFFGLNDWITNDNGVVDKALLECTDCEQQFTAEWGFAIHMFFNGLLLIPLVTLLLLVVSFFAKVPGGIAYAGTLVGLVVLQVIVLPELSRAVDPALGGLHGVNALVLLGVAVAAGRKASAAMGTTPAATGQPVVA